MSVHEYLWKTSGIPCCMACFCVYHCLPPVGLGFVFERKKFSMSLICLRQVRKMYVLEFDRTIFVYMPLGCHLSLIY